MERLMPSPSFFVGYILFRPSSDAATVRQYDYQVSTSQIGSNAPAAFIPLIS